MSAAHLDELLEHLNVGDEAAAEQVFRIYEPYLRMLVRRQLRPPLRAKFDSMDVVQSVWADVLEGVRDAGWHFADRGQLQAFLARLARNRFLDRCRKHNRALDREEPLTHGLAGRGDRLATRPGPARSRSRTSSGTGCSRLCPPAHHELLRLKRAGADPRRDRRADRPAREQRPAILYDLAAALRREQSRPRRAAGTGRLRGTMASSRSVAGLAAGPDAGESARDARHVEADGRRLAPRRAAPGRGVPRPASRARRRGRGPAHLRRGLPPPGGGRGVRLGRDLPPLPALALQAGAAARLPTGCCGPPPEADFPEVGEDLGDFRLLAELGRGAHGRTYLASQRSLADRPVVLKITPLGHDEHLSLARLQHMHIVPLYFEQVLPDRNLRVLGMPYLGGATLDRILDGAPRRPGRSAHGPPHPRALDRCGRSRAILPREYPPERPVPRTTWRRRPTSGGLLDRRPAWPTRCSTPTTAGWSTWT